MTVYNRRDTNESEITAYWERCGWIWKPMDRLAGFDGLLMHPSRHIVYVVEIKNARARWKLTKAEAEMKERIGGLYHVITCQEDAERLISGN